MFLAHRKPCSHWMPCSCWMYWMIRLDLLVRWSIKSCLYPFVFLYTLSVLFFHPPTCIFLAQELWFLQLIYTSFPLFLHFTTLTRYWSQILHKDDALSLVAVFRCLTQQWYPGCSHPPKGKNLPFPCLLVTQKPSSPFLPPPHIPSCLYLEEEENHSWVVRHFRSSWCSKIKDP